MSQSIPQINEPDIKKELIKLYQTKKAILMVGAGSSAFVGYPLWRELVIDLRDQFYIDYPEPSDTTNLVEYAQKIKQKAIDDGRLREYHKCLLETFRPFQEGERYKSFHESLVKLGFCGIVTTNYDKVLEIAVQAAFTERGNSHNCEPLDLCEDKSYSIFPFLRSLHHNNHSAVLHLHGYYQNPETIILTSKDYSDKYGSSYNDGNEDKKLNTNLDHLHRKVIWGLLAFHPFLFVGFSLTDPAFLQILKIVQADFELHRDYVHYAIMGYKGEEDRIRIAEELKYLGIRPTFYRIMINSDGSEDHTGLVDLISELEHTLELAQIPTQISKQPPAHKEGKRETSAGFPSLGRLNKITGG